MTSTGMPGLGAGLPLLAAAAEDERVAALEPDDPLAGPGVLDEQLVDALLRGEGAARDLGDVDDLGVRGRLVEHGERGQPVGDHHVGAADGGEAGDGDQAGVARAAADEHDRALTALGLRGGAGGGCRRPGRPRRRTSRRTTTSRRRVGDDDEVHGVEVDRAGRAALEADLAAFGEVDERVDRGVPTTRTIAPASSSDADGTERVGPGAGDERPRGRRGSSVAVKLTPGTVSTAAAQGCAGGLVADRDRAASRRRSPGTSRPGGRRTPGRAAPAAASPGPVGPEPAAVDEHERRPGLARGRQAEGGERVDEVAAVGPRADGPRRRPRRARLGRQAGDRRGQRRRRHRPRRLLRAQPGDERGVADDVAGAQPGQAPGLGQRAEHEHARAGRRRSSDSGSPGDRVHERLVDDEDPTGPAQRAQRRGRVEHARSGSSGCRS